MYYTRREFPQRSCHVSITYRVLQVMTTWFLSAFGLLSSVSISHSLLRCASWISAQNSHDLAYPKRHGQETVFEEHFLSRSKTDFKPKISMKIKWPDSGVAYWLSNIGRKVFNQYNSRTRFIFPAKQNKRRPWLDQWLV